MTLSVGEDLSSDSEHYIKVITNTFEGKSLKFSGVCEHVVI